MPIRSATAPGRSRTRPFALTLGPLVALALGPLAALALGLLLLVHAPLASAARPPEHASAPPSPSEALRERILDEVPGCACAGRAELQARRDQIAGSHDVASARELALADVEQARRALGVARRIAPLSPRLRDAGQRLDVYAAQVAQARDPEEVAQHFSVLVQESGEGVVGVDGDRDGGDGGRCNLSTREIIAVVLGLILGIIPGLILLVLLC